MPCLGLKSGFYPRPEVAPEPGPRVCFELKLGGIPAGPCILNHGHQPPHRDQMGNEWRNPPDLAVALADVAAVLEPEGAFASVEDLVVAARERIPAWRDAAGAIAALAELLGLEPPPPSPDEIVAVAVDGLLLLRELRDASVESRGWLRPDLARAAERRLRQALLRADAALGKMKLPPAEGGPE